MKVLKTRVQPGGVPGSSSAKYKSYPKGMKVSKSRVHPRGVLGSLRAKYKSYPKGIV
jgi:hypothetical protein